MSEHIDDLSVQYEEGGEVVVEELDKVVLTRGSWTTILFKYRQWDQRKEDFSPTKFTIRRYQKRHGTFRQQSKFNISSAKQAGMIVEALSAWIEDEGADAE